MRLTLGEMLQQFRRERDIEANKICWGLCSASMMSNFENGENTPDTLLFEYLMERMGVPSEEFSIMVSKDEYAYHEWKEKVCEAIEDSNWCQLKQFLKSEVTRKVYCNKKIENQFYLYACAVYYASKDNFIEAYRLLEISIKQTMPNIIEIIDNRKKISVQEIYILILYLYYGIKGQRMSISKGEILFQVLESYISDKNLDIIEQTKCYPKLVCVGIHCFKEMMSDVKRIELCEKSLQILREGKRFFDVLELLRLYIPLLEKHNIKDVGFYKKHFEVFYDLVESEGMCISFQPELFYISRPKIYIISEYLSYKREINRLTQLQVSEGICEPETYSRIESGKRAPSKRNLKAMTEKLDINWCYYRGELETSDRTILELRRAERKADIEGRREDSLEILIQMEACLDMNNIINQQYIKSNIYITKYRLGLMDAIEVFEKLKKLLYLTKKTDFESQKLVYYSQTELEIIGMMAQVLRKQAKHKDGIKLIENVLNQMSNSSVHIKHQWNGFDFLVRILSGLYFAKGDYKTSVDISRYIKSIMVRRKKGANLAEVLDEIADGLEHMGEQYREECKKLYRYTFYIADFFYIDKITNSAKSYYEETFEKELIWYEN